MASIVDDPGGKRRILFVAPDESRKTIRLGKIDRKTAETICRHVEALLSAKTNNDSLKPATASWLADIGPKLKKKLAGVGLIDAPKRAKLGEFLNRFIDNRKSSVAANTLTNFEQSKRYLVDYFGADRDLASITHADAEAWAASMAERYAPATVGRTVKRARQFFKTALRDKIIVENVFTELKAAGQPNKERQFHVDREVIFRVIEAAPDAEWRLLIALSRFGGLRCPSEHLALRWQDVNWERNRFCVNSPKTGTRWVPIFPELAPHLEDCFDRAKEGAVHIITRYRDCNANLRTMFKKIIKRAGETPWPKLFHNLRASRETELAAQYPIHVVCEWIGNTAAIAAKHYLTVREEDYAKATAKSGAESGAPVAQKAAQYAAVANCKEGKKATQAESGTKVVPLSACASDYWPECLVPPRGVEPSANPSQKLNNPRQGGAESGALADESAPGDPGLAELAAAWATLPDLTKANVLATVRAVVGATGARPKTRQTARPR